MQVASGFGWGKLWGIFFCESGGELDGLKMRVPGKVRLEKFTVKRERQAQAHRTREVGEGLGARLACRQPEGPGGQRKRHSTRRRPASGSVSEGPGPNRV